MILVLCFHSFSSLTVAETQCVFNNALLHVVGYKHD